MREDWKQAGITLILLLAFAAWVVIVAWAVGGGLHP